MTERRVDTARINRLMEKCRYDCAVQVDRTFAARDGIGIETVAGGRYAWGRCCLLCMPVRPL
jgi:hypothetical protein